MPGPAPKHPSVRARRNNPTAGFTALPSDGRKGKVPEWPLLPDIKMQATLDTAQDKVASLMAELETVEDGRTKGRLKRQLEQTEQTVALVKIQLEQAGDMERDLWALLWSTPQATMWDASAAFARMLAQFVRWNVKGEQGDLDAAKEARLRGAEFGLTPLKLMSLKAEVERAGEAEDRGKKRREKAEPKSKREQGDDPRQALRSVS